MLTSAALDVFEQEPVDPIIRCSRWSTSTVRPTSVPPPLRPKAAGMDIATNVMNVLAGRKCEFVMNGEHL